jgi:hypothetical protein
VKMYAALQVFNCVAGPRCNAVGKLRRRAAAVCPRTCGCKALAGELLLLDGQAQLLGLSLRAAAWQQHVVEIGPVEAVLVWPAWHDPPPDDTCCSSGCHVCGTRVALLALKHCSLCGSWCLAGAAAVPAVCDVQVYATRVGFRLLVASGSCWLLPQLLPLALVILGAWVSSMRWALCSQQHATVCEVFSSAPFASSWTSAGNRPAAAHALAQLLPLTCAPASRSSS